MERYQRAYRDANSPLTPLTPLVTNVFDFNMNNEQQAAGKSPLTAGLEALSYLFQCERGHRLGSASTSNVALEPYTKRENTPSTRRPMLPARQKRGGYAENRLVAVKSENLENIPRISIEPPPRRKRHHAQERNDAENCNISDLCADANFLRQQQEQLEKYESKNKRRFDASNVRLASPVPPKPLSPRLGAFLTSWGMNCLKSIFERQEIDLQTFCSLTSDDLRLLGIEDAAKRDLVLKGVEFLRQKLDCNDED